MKFLSTLALLGAIALIPLTSWAASPAPEGIYIGNLPASDYPERTFMLEVREKGFVRLTTKSPKSEKSVREGTWQTKDDILHVTLAGEKRAEIIWKIQYKALIPRSWDHSIWGKENPPVLKMKSATRHARWLENLGLLMTGTIPLNW